MQKCQNTRQQTTNFRLRCSCSICVFYAITVQQIKSIDCEFNFDLFICLFVFTFRHCTNIYKLDGYMNVLADQLIQILCVC